MPNDELLLKVDEILLELNTAFEKLRLLKQRHPELITSSRPNDVGSILNGYREGDLNFNEAVAAITRIEEPSTMWIHCSYFKMSGKWYTDGRKRYNRDLFSGCIYPRDYAQRLRQMKDLPGINSGWEEGFILIEPEDKYAELLPPAAWVMNKDEVAARRAGATSRGPAFEEGWFEAKEWLLGREMVADGAREEKLRDFLNKVYDHRTDFEETNQGWIKTREDFIKEFIGNSGKEP